VKRNEASQVSQIKIDDDRNHLRIILQDAQEEEDEEEREIGKVNMKLTHKESHLKTKSMSMERICYQSLCHTLVVPGWFVGEGFLQAPWYPHKYNGIHMEANIIYCFASCLDTELWFWFWTE
jgi:hypothetical protein